MNISFNLLSHCVSLHDLKQNYNENDINEFITKYRRRYNRFIEHIKNNETICFLRYGISPSDNVKGFIEAILAINPNKKFKLVYLNGNTDVNTMDNYIIHININLFKKDDYDYSEANVERHFHYDYPKLLSYLSDSIAEGKML
jgi:hypothetical protein